MEVSDGNSGPNTRLCQLLLSSAASSALLVRRWGCRRSWDSWPRLTKGRFIWHSVMLSKKSWLQEEEGCSVLAFIFPRKHFIWQVLLSWKWLHICLPMESSEWTLYFALLACKAFPLAIKLPFISNPLVFSLIPLQFSPPSHCWVRVSKRQPGAELLLGVRPQHAAIIELLKIIKFI